MPDSAALLEQSSHVAWCASNFRVPASDHATALRTAHRCGFVVLSAAVDPEHVSAIRRALLTLLADAPDSPLLARLRPSDALPNATLSETWHSHVASARERLPTFPPRSRTLVATELLAVIARHPVMGAARPESGVPSLSIVTSRSWPSTHRRKCASLFHTPNIGLLEMARPQKHAMGSSSRCIGGLCGLVRLTSDVILVPYTRRLCHWLALEGC